MHRHQPLAKPLSAIRPTGRLGGVLLTLGFALLGWSVSLLPGLDRLGPLASALIAAVLYRHFFGYPERLQAGIRLSSGTLLRLAVVLYGLRLDVRVILGSGFSLLAVVAVTIVFSLIAVTTLGRLWKAEKPLTLLLAFGTGICGAAAIAAVSPILRSREEDTAISAGMIALTGTAFAVVYALLQPWLPFDAAHYGIWAGASLHEVTHVAMAAAPAGSEAIADGLLAKLARVFLLVPVCLILLARMKRQNAGAQEASRRIPFPWFLLGFAAMSLVKSYGLPALGIDAAPIVRDTSYLTTLLLSMAMAGLGLGVSLRDLRSRALLPLLALAASSVLLSALTYWIVRNLL